MSSLNHHSRTPSHCSHTPSYHSRTPSHRSHTPSALKPSWQTVLMAALLALSLVGTLASRPAAAQPRFDQRGRAHQNFRGFNSREVRVDRGRFFDHGRFYPRRGAFFRVLPVGYRTFYWAGRPYFFAGGVWYVAGPGGYVVAAPPFGLRVAFLPPVFTTVWYGGVPYYYADDVYYQWNPAFNSYVVVAPPGGVAPLDPGDAGPPPVAGGPVSPGPPQQMFIYPKNGQSQAQQNQDQYECHTWATGQTGFDPTQPGGGVPPDQNAARSQAYQRAMGACLTARGYSVN